MRPFLARSGYRAHPRCTPMSLDDPVDAISTVLLTPHIGLRIGREIVDGPVVQAVIRTHLPTVNPNVSADMQGRRLNFLARVRDAIVDVTEARRIYHKDINGCSLAGRCADSLLTDHSAPLRRPGTC